MSLRLEHFSELFDLTAKARVLLARDDAHAAFSASSFNFENWLEQILCEMPHNIDHNAVSRKVVSLIVVLGQLVVVIETHQSRGLSCDEINRDRILFPSTTMMVCRLEPPAGVRRHPATSSNRISARCTFTPFSSYRVRL